MLIQLSVYNLSENSTIMLNLLTTLTNFTAYLPIRTALVHEDYLTAGIVGFAAASSAVSHLFESHKHDMWGFGMNPNISYLLNRGDIFGACLTLARVSYLWYQSSLGLNLFTQNKLFLGICLACVYLVISEQDPGYHYYVPLHCVWHLSIFCLLDRFLKLVY